MKSEHSPASPLVQEIRFRSQTCSNFPQQTNCEKEYQGHHEFWCDGCLLRLLTAEYETLQREKAEIEHFYDGMVAAVEGNASDFQLSNPHVRAIDDMRRFKEAAEARAEAAEGRERERVCGTCKRQFATPVDECFECWRKQNGR